MQEIKSFEERKKDLVKLGLENDNKLTYEQLADALTVNLYLYISLIL